MNKFQNDKRKALNREYARLHYLIDRAHHLTFRLHKIRSSKRFLKTIYLLSLNHVAICLSRAQILAIRQQPIPIFPSGGVVSTVQFETINIHKDARKPERVAIMGFGGRNTGRYWAQKMAGELRVGIDTAIGKDKTAYTEYKDGKVSKIDFTEAIEALRNHKPKID